MPPEVVTEGATEMPGEMIAAGVVGAAREPAGVVATVKTHILAADSSHEIPADFLFHGCHTVDKIEAVEDRAIRNGTEEHTAIGNSVQRPANTRRHVATETEVVLQDDVSAKAHIQAPTFRWDSVRASRSSDGSKAQRCVNLLRLKAGRTHKHQHQGKQDKGLSQVKSPQPQYV